MKTLKTWPNCLLELVRQGHILRIERLLKEGASWDKIGKETGWLPAVVEEHYAQYLKIKSKEGK